MRVLVVGGGGREHAICVKLSQSPNVSELLCAPGNGGIASVAECVPVIATDIQGIVALSREKAVDFVVVAPDDPLAMGCVDALEKAGVPAFGPTASAARIEASKTFSKSLMREYNIPTARWASFDDVVEAVRYLDGQSLPIVIKCDGLALGKGVIIAQTRAEAESAVCDMLEGERFSEAGRRVVIEEFMEGREVTVLAFCDGETVVPMPASRDHKRAFDGDRGPNTGGMGAVCPVPDYTPELAARCMDEIFLPTVRAMNAEGCPFKGVLYFGLMLTKDGPKVVEYNARFGDPETQAVLSLLDTDLMEILLAVREGRLKDITITWKPGAAAVVVLASGGYPGDYGKGYAISGLDSASDCEVYHAGTARTGEGYVTAGGRVLGVTAVGGTLTDALENAYRGAAKISFSGAHYRKDIGSTTKELLQYNG